VALKGLLVGSPGSGKTSILATANDCPEMAPLCVLDFESGLLAVAHRGDVYREQIKSMKHLDEVFWAIVNRKSGWEMFKTIGLDSASELADLCLQEIVGAAFDKATSNSELAHRDDVDSVMLQDYGKSTRRATRLFRWLRDLDGINVIMTALPKDVYAQPPSNASQVDKDRFRKNIDLGLIQPSRTAPAFTEKLGVSVLGFLDFAFYLHSSLTKAGESQRELLTAPVGPFRFIKCRNPRAAEVFGKGQEVAFEGGKPMIGGKPAMQYLYDGFKVGCGNGV